SPRADPARPLPARGLGERPFDGRDRDRRAEEVMGLAHLAAPIACAGFAVLLLARTRENRIAGLGYAAVGTALLAAALPSPGATQLALAVVVILGLGWTLSLALRREPWLVAYLTLAAVPVRIHFLHHHILLPLFIIASGAAFNLLRELIA